MTCAFVWLSGARRGGGGHGGAWVNRLASAARRHLAKAEALMAAHPDAEASEQRKIDTHINDPEFARAMAACIADYLGGSEQ